jgi:hypothetical protein
MCSLKEMQKSAIGEVEEENRRALARQMHERDKMIEDQRARKEVQAMMMMFTYINCKQGCQKIFSLCFHINQPERHKYKKTPIMIRNKLPIGAGKTESGRRGNGSE